MPSFRSPDPTQESACRERYLAQRDDALQGAPRHNGYDWLPSLDYVTEKWPILLMMICKIALLR
jgi:hypothetical protein